MLDGMPLVDVHLHAARKPTLKLPWEAWVQGFAGSAVKKPPTAYRDAFCDLGDRGQA